MAETITKYYAMDDSLLQYGQEGGETNPNATTMQDMQEYMKQNGDTLEHVVNSILWQPETDYVVGQEIHSPNIPAGYIAVCSVAGQSGETEPSWSTTYSTFTDGTVTWNIVGSVAILSGGKVSKSDVTNNLTTEVEGKVLDARQGKVLSDKIYSKTHNYSTQEIYVSPLADYTVPSDGIFVASGYGGCLIKVIINGVSMALFEAKTVDSINNTYFSFRVNQGDTVYVHTNNATACNGCKFRPVA